MGPEHDRAIVGVPRGEIALKMILHEDKQQMNDFPIRLTHAAKVTAQKYGGVAPVVVKARDEIAALIAGGGPVYAKWRQSGGFMHCFRMGKDADEYEFIATPSRDATALVVDAGEIGGEKLLTSGPLKGKKLIMPRLVSGGDEEMFGGLDGTE